MTARSLSTGLAVALAASLLGLFGLPLLFGRLPGPSQGVLWLVAAVVCCICLIVPTRPLATALANLLARLPGRARQTLTTHSVPFEIARLVVAAGYLVLVQAILRHPLVAVLGAGAEPFLIEAVFAVAALLVLMTLLGWLHRTAKPVVEGLAWVALDSALATSGSGAPEPPTPTRVSGSGRSAAPAGTVQADGVTATVQATGATVAVQPDGAADTRTLSR
jgi:hypothetical protein